MSVPAWPLQQVFPLTWLTAPCTDADRNLISNIHARGNHVEDVADRIADLALRIVTLKRSGTTLKAQAAQLPY